MRTTRCRGSVRLLRKRRLKTGEAAAAEEDVVVFGNVPLGLWIGERLFFRCVPLLPSSSLSPLPFCSGIVCFLCSLLVIFFGTNIPWSVELYKRAGKTTRHPCSPLSCECSSLGKAMEALKGTGCFVGLCEWMISDSIVGPRGACISISYSFGWNSPPSLCDGIRSLLKLLSVT
ncbi:hypothetical protein BXZ70DRAFT_222857 [Cristinia sonorae]|uniref:Uncharacterized protein n=1 Tax=Cristinia sonorae TaxID=1940300 RepID=A0A8K0XP94_9AGAR|nr:hypothetical protein BXZ70DRAFT_222857 [Cristinia sonorae]